MNEPTKKPEEGIVVGGRKSRMGFDIGGVTRKLVRPVFWLLILVVIGAAAYFGWKHWHNDASPKAGTANKHLTQAQINAQANSDNLNRLQSLIDSTNDPVKKAGYQVELAQEYATNKNYDAALKYAKDAEKTKPSMETASALGNVYIDMKDYSNAIHYLTLARDRTQKPASAQERSPYNDLTAQIEQLKQLEKQQ